jgi:hypothetical protein
VYDEFIKNWKLDKLFAVVEAGERGSGGWTWDILKDFLGFLRVCREFFFMFLKRSLF